MSREENREPEVLVPPGLVDAIDDALRGLALRRETTTYLALAQALAVPPPHHLRKVMLALELLAIRAALVVSRTREPIPAPGFFAHLLKLGAYAGAEEGQPARRWHEAELARIYAR